MKIIPAVVLPSLLALGACTTPYGNDPYGQSGYPPQSYPPQSYPAPYPEPYPQPYPAPPGSSEYRATVGNNVLNGINAVLYDTF